MLIQIFSKLVFLTFLSTFSPEQSTVTFAVSNFGVHTVEGSFGTMEGIFSFDKEHPAKAEINIKVPVNSINTGIEKRDKHLQAAEYFNVKAHPYMQFKSTSVSKTTRGLLLKGILTIKGISKKLEVPASYTPQGLSCNFTIDRYDFKVGDSGSFTIGRKVNVAVYLAF